MAETHDLDRLAGGVIVGGFDGTEAPAETVERLSHGHLAGVTLFKRNIVDPAQCARLCAQLADAASHDEPLVIAIDQEGGRVARLGPPVVTLPAMRVLGAIDDVDLTRRAAALLGAQLAAIGITVDFAPVADVDTHAGNPVIGDRAFGSDAALVARHVVAFNAGLEAGGVVGCAKHFPGHGDTRQDSHLELPRVAHDRARLDAVELVPFRAAIGAGVAAVMTAHVVFDALAPSLPATLSRAVVTDLLRGQLGFTGVCFSDDLHMKAVAAKHAIESSAVLAIEAGCDALLICSDPASQERARLALAAHARKDLRFAGRLREAFGRLLALRRRVRPTPPRIDAAQVAALVDEIARRSSALTA